MTTPYAGTAASTNPTPPIGGRVKTVAVNVASRGAQSVAVPKPVPAAFGRASMIIVAWGIALAIIFWDEWKRHHIFARPSRLWWTTLVYGILAVVGMSGALLPIANALAIGYTIVLAWQYFNGSGQFAPASGNGSGDSGGQWT